MQPRPPRATLFPYTTLFRSHGDHELARLRRLRRRAGPRGAAGHGTRERGLDHVETALAGDRKSTRLNSSHVEISYAVFCLKKKTNNNQRSIVACRTDDVLVR